MAEELTLAELKQFAALGRRPPRKRAGRRSGAVSVKRIIEGLVRKHPEEVKKAILDGIKAKPPKSVQYLQLCAQYLDGRPAEGASPLIGPGITVILRAPMDQDPLAGRREAVAALRQTIAGTVPEAEAPEGPPP